MTKYFIIGLIAVASIDLFGQDETSSPVASLYWPFPDSKYIGSTSFGECNNSGSNVFGSQIGTHGWVLFGKSCVSPTHNAGDDFAEDWVLNSSCGFSSTFDEGNGKEIRAPFSGYVLYAGEASSDANGYGNQVIIQSELDASIVVRITHLASFRSNLGSCAISDLDICNDPENTTPCTTSSNTTCHVDAGDIIGYLGNSNGQAEYHAHIVLYKDLFEPAANAERTGMFQLLSFLDRPIAKFAADFRLNRGLPTVQTSPPESSYGDIGVSQLTATVNDNCEIVLHATIKNYSCLDATEDRFGIYLDTSLVIPLHYTINQDDEPAIENSEEIVLGDYMPNATAYFAPRTETSIIDINTSVIIDPEIEEGYTITLHTAWDRMGQNGDEDPSNDYFDFDPETEELDSLHLTLENIPEQCLEEEDEDNTANKRAIGGCGNSRLCQANQIVEHLIWILTELNTESQPNPNPTFPDKDSPPLTYEWYRNDKLMKVTTESQLKVPLEDAEYKVVIKDGNTIVKTLKDKLTISLFDCTGTDGSNGTGGTEDFFPPLCKGCGAWQFPVFWPLDPNDIQGPKGYGPDRWIPSTTPIPYTIRFENDPELATASAQRVEINLSLPENIDPYSLQLGSFGFANQVFEVPEDRSFFSQRLSVSSALGVDVDVISGIDISNQRIFWIFQALDPITGRIPIDAEAGFLPINDSLSHKGEGFVQFTIKPQEVSTGDMVKAQASIIFDTNEPILTNSTFNTLDTTPPNSILSSTYEVLDSTHVNLSWTANDAGSGLSTYDIYVAKPGQSFERVAAYIKEKAYILEVAYDVDYAVYVVARDNAGNRENKSEPELTINSRSDLTTGTEDINKYPYFSVSPNPITNHVTITLFLPHKSPIRITLEDILGRKLKTLYQGSLQQGTVHTSLPDFPEGLYLVSLHSIDGRVTRKILIKHD